MSSVPCILALSQRFLGHSACEEELRPPHKHHPRLVLLHMPSSTTRLCRVIWFPYGFRYGKVETQHWDVGEIGITREWRLVIQAGALLINAMFCDRKMRWEVGRDKVISGCGLSRMSLDDDKWDYVMRSCGHDITLLLNFLNKIIAHFFRVL